MRTARWNSFVPSAEGNTVVMVVLGDHHLTGECDIKIDLVKKDGKIITHRGSLHEMRRICHSDMHIYNSSKRKWLQR